MSINPISKQVSEAEIIINKNIKRLLDANACVSNAKTYTGISYFVTSSIVLLPLLTPYFSIGSAGISIVLSSLSVNTVSHLIFYNLCLEQTLQEFREKTFLNKNILSLMSKIKYNIQQRTYNVSLNEYERDVIGIKIHDINQRYGRDAKVSILDIDNYAKHIAETQLRNVERRRIEKLSIDVDKMHKMVLSLNDEKLEMIIAKILLNVEYQQRSIKYASCL